MKNKQPDPKNNSSEAASWNATFAAVMRELRRKHQPQRSVAKVEKKERRWRMQIPLAFGTILMFVHVAICIRQTLKSRLQ
ncbi:hypothetical protein ANCCAN_23080 [Ancylostoma caninum]|uniref:Uncharacterized protein n=1 Tax=Ancylostoma caninum TaxID=29170 RepID=A0A368FHX8_ANCCA|nr:hypothetical protein ANCCAN_23080 [Ancylostoma caninum]